MMTGQALSLLPLEDGFVELRFDRRDEKVNKFDALTLSELSQAVSQLAETEALRGVLVTSAKTSFIVGADIFELDRLFRRPAAEIAEEIARQSAIFSAFEDLPAPIVAALNGAALGGGLEFALTADYRIIDPQAQIGLPEVTLGIFPGYGGTVRLPRLIEAELAAAWIISGKPQSATGAFEAGAVDTVSAPGASRHEALARLHLAAADGGWKARRERRGSAISPFDPARLADLKSDAARQAHLYPAPQAALEQIETTAPLERDAALRHEAERLGRIASGPTAAGLIQAFINGQQLKKKAASYVKAGRPIRQAGILGAGVMGGGIAFTSASRGIPAIMKDISQAALDAGIAEADGLLARQRSQGRLDEEAAAAIRHSIRTTLDYREFGSVDIVVEAVVENMAVKRKVIAEVEAATAPGTVIVSNTSSLAIGALAEASRRPEDFAGMHFFNPVPAMPLVEVIRGPATSDRTAATVAGYAAAMGKTPIVVRDCAGFLVNRVLISSFVGFLMLLRDGADFRQIDRVMEEAGWPMGTAYLLDVIGLDTCAHVIDFIATAYDDRMKITFANPLKRLVDAGRLGQKNRTGFYRYEPDAKGRRVKRLDPTTDEILNQCRQTPARPFDDAVILDRLIVPILHEAVHCLAEGIAETPAEIDVAMVLGISFPRHLGGPLKYVDLTGANNIVRRAGRIAHLGPLYTPPPTLVRMAEEDRPFYGDDEKW